MLFASFTSRLLAPIERLVAVLTNPAQRERAVIGVLAAYAAIWTLYGAIAKGSQDIHYDMGEAVGWSRELALGYPKHPPLEAWLVRAWFSVFPLADWSYYFFAIILATLGLWIAWRLSEQYLDSEKRVVGLALLTLVPFFNFHGLKFNANTVLIPVWAATTWWFLRSYETRNIAYAALAGVAAGMAMLGKYWSITLLAGLAIAVLLDRRRKDYFRSAAPWVTIATSALVFAPHVAWLIANDFPTFKYASESHLVHSRWEAAGWGLGYIAGAIGYVAAPILLTLAASRPDRAALADTAWPAEPSRRIALMAFIMPISLPAAIAVAAQSQVVSLWAMSAMTLLPVVLLSSPLLKVPRVAVMPIVALAVALPLLATLVSPLIAFVIHHRGVPHNATHYQLLAAAIEKSWRATSDRPLRIVGGDSSLVYGAVFYAVDKPSVFPNLDARIAPWINEERLARDGIALVCPVTDRGCISGIEARAGSAGRRAEVELIRSYFGVAGPPGRYLIIIVPPRGN